MGGMVKLKLEKQRREREDNLMAEGILTHWTEGDFENLYEKLMREEGLTEENANKWIEERKEEMVRRSSELVESISYLIRSRREELQEWERDRGSSNWTPPGM